MANINDAMDTVQHNVRILDEALVRLEGGDETAREEAVGAAQQALTALREIRDSLLLPSPKRWITADSGPDYLADDSPHDPRD